MLYIIKNLWRFLFPVKPCKHEMGVEMYEIDSANAVGSGNMLGMINNYRHIHRLPQNCVRVQIEHTV